MKESTKIQYQEIDTTKNEILKNGKRLLNLGYGDSQHQGVQESTEWQFQWTVWGEKAWRYVLVTARETEAAVQITLWKIIKLKEIGE